MLHEWIMGFSHVSSSDALSKQNKNVLHLHLCIWQMLLSKTTYIAFKVHALSGLASRIQFFVVVNNIHLLKLKLS